MRGGARGAKHLPASSALSSLCEPKALLPEHCVCTPAAEKPRPGEGAPFGVPRSPWVFPLVSVPSPPAGLGTAGSPCPVATAESVGRAASSCWLWDCSQPASHTATPSCVARSRLPMDVSPTPRPAMCAYGSPDACAAVGRAQGALPRPYLCPRRTRAEAGALQQGHPLPRGRAGRTPRPCYSCPGPSPAAVLGTPGGHPSSAGGCRLCAGVCVCSLGGAAFLLRGARWGKHPTELGQSAQLQARSRRGISPAGSVSGPGAPGRGCCLTQRGGWTGRALPPARAAPSEPQVRRVRPL